METGSKLTTKKHALIISYCKGGASCRIAKRGKPWVPVRRAGVFVRNKYRALTSRITDHFTTSGHQSAYFGSEVQCYGEHRFEPGDLIGELVDVQPTHLDMIIDSKVFEPHLEPAFKIAIGIALDKNTCDAFTTLPELKNEGTKEK